MAGRKMLEIEFGRLEEAINKCEIEKAKEAINRIIGSSHLACVKIMQIYERNLKLEMSHDQESLEKITDGEEVSQEALNALLELGVDENTAQKIANSVKSAKEAKRKYKDFIKHGTWI